VATNKQVIKFYADPEIEEWLSTLPANTKSRSAFINDMLRAGRASTFSSQSTSPLTESVSVAAAGSSQSEEFRAVKRSIANLDIDSIEYDKQITALEQWKAQSEEQLEDLSEWKQSFPDQQLFENLGTDDIITALELLNEIGKDGILSAVELVPRLEKRLDALEDQVNQLLSAVKDES
jgi:type IV secretory pathway VirD2 relaxase